jgi:hypothetical protein
VSYSSHEVVWKVLPPGILFLLTKVAGPACYTKENYAMVSVIKDFAIRKRI